MVRGFPLSPTVYLICALSVRPIWETGIMFLILLLRIGVWKAPPQFPSSFKAVPPLISMSSLLSQGILDKSSSDLLSMAKLLIPSLANPS
jgi:hypothetical protein